MNKATQSPIAATSYVRSACDVGVLHLGFGAFHRAHQAVYLDDYMQTTGDLRWGICAVNLRAAESAQFEEAVQDIERHDGYFLKSYSAAGQVALRRVRSHVKFADWSTKPAQTEALLAAESVHLVTITVTESGYYTGPAGELNLQDPVIVSEVAGQSAQSVYAYLRAGLAARLAAVAAPLTIACCDNIRQNGKKLGLNLLAYLKACGDVTLYDWVADNVAFPCSMVDRITPRPPVSLQTELTDLIGRKVSSPIMAEDFIQWVLQDSAKSAMPELAKAGVTVTSNVDPYEETKIRVLNGGHTGLAYLAALSGIETFDQAMAHPDLYEHFYQFETEEVLAAIQIDLPFSKEDYLTSIASRFSNGAIGDTVARICADGFAKFPIFIRPTLRGCLDQGITPVHTLYSIASWHQFARHVAAGKIPFEYMEPSWNELSAMLGTDDFVTSRVLWGDLPETYPVFVNTLRNKIFELEQKWPV